ncbi:MAG TPA: lipoprotein-releasing ABC transporter permease subunit [Caulobacterales bacterium]|nr:lipoprotein-releasing ABC transporter permease subunit [Caulobacterales bacterium]
MTARSRPFGLFERMLAGRYLRAKRQHGGVAMISVISVVGVMLAVAVLIITMSVMNGFRETLLSHILGVNGHVFIDTRDMTPTEVARVTQIARTVPHVTHAAPIIEEQALVAANGQASGVIVRAVSRDDIRALAEVYNSLQNPHALDGFEGVEAPTILIGDRLAAKLGVREGMALSIVAPQAAQTPFGFAPRSKSFMIGGVFSVGVADFDVGIVYMPIEQAQILFSRGDGVDRIEIRVDDLDRIQATEIILRDKLGPRVDIYDWRAQSQGLSDALVVERNVMRLILMMIVAIASLNIVAGLLMLVKNKSRDIAILRTMGATQGAVMRVFLMCGGVVGVVGTAAGVLVGTLFCIYIKPIQDFISTVVGFDIFPGTVYSLESLPAKLEWPEVALISGWALLMSLLWTLPTAWRASKLDPVEALRYE